MRAPTRQRFPLRPASLAAAALLVAFAVQTVASMRLLSVTSDEITHIPSGYTYLATGEIRLNPQHPPLVKLLSAIPVWFLEPDVDLEHPSLTADPPREWEFGFRFFEANDADRILFWARLPVVLLSLLAGWVVFRWARELFGEPAGLLALGLYAFSPNLIAHSRFVTMDVPLAAFTLVTLYALWTYMRRGGALRLVAGGLTLGAALATKFSAVLLLPVVAALLAVNALIGGGPPRSDGAPAAEPGSWNRRLSRAAGILALLLVSAAVVVQAAYLFPSDPLAYVDGVERVNRDHDPDYPYYLHGEFRKGGFPHYFLVAFLVKTPLPTLALLGLSLVLWRRSRAPRRIDELFLALPVAVFSIATAALADNLGVRYLLPIYPLLFIWISRVAKRLPRSLPARAGAGLLAAWYVFAAVAIFPDHLAYFNEIAGGPANGHRWLDDSNIDWGQDLKRLKGYLERSGIDRVRLLYSGNASADYYDIPWENATEQEWAMRPQPGVYAVSTQLLIRGEYHARTRGVATDWLSRHEPIGRVGYSIYLFRFE